MRSRSVHGQGGYTRQRVRLTFDHVDRALDLVIAGKVPGRGIDYADTKAAGLVLRITPQAATWYLKTEKATVRLGAADRLTLDEARNQALLAKISLKRGRDPRRQVAAFEVQRSNGDSVAAAAGVAAAVDDTPNQSESDRRTYGPWLWCDLVEEFLTAKRKKLRASYVGQYESYLRHGAFDRIKNRRVSEVRIADLEGVRNAIVRANATSTAWRAVQQGKDMLSWAWRYHAGVSGLDACEYEWWSRWSVEYQTGVREHVPTVEELARTLAIAERHRTLGGTEHATSSGALAALWAVVLTVQRTGPLVELKRDRLFDLPDKPGWRTANWTGAQMKGGRSGERPHALPFPPAGLAALDRVWSELEDWTPWCFPSARGNGHVSQTSLNQLLYRLQGRVNGKAAGGSGRPAGATRDQAVDAP